METTKIESCPVCHVKMDEPWHSANGFQVRIAIHKVQNKTREEFIYRPKWTNCCHCPHSDCTSNDCHDYHNNIRPSISDAYALELVANL